ncbi:ABC transporter permease [Tropicimonas sp. IMCC6043]|uniref:ABC transporter permease n=1 Tax=Tropicimonas sp. IMCC6043 TaxID=2510645 RepID=UPI00101B7E4E|nr:ABC transporter permease [Tropicimonas sp. IMCC6043]RYH12387.1 ABC transporter permease [Tropicimonas sp. IMCC6043]
MTLWSLALRNLAGIKPRVIATIAGIMVSIASLVALVGIARGVEGSLGDSLDARGTDVIITEAGALDLMSSILPDSLAAEIAARPGIAAAASEIARITSLEDGSGVAVVGWAPESFAWDGLETIAGHLPRAGTEAVAVLGQGLAERGGLAPGDRITLFQTEFTIAAVVSANSMLARNLVYLPLGTLQALTFREGLATSVLVQLAPGSEAERDTTLRRLRADYTGFAVEPSEILARQYSVARVARVLSMAISVIALLSAFLVTFNTMSMAVTERRDEIAIMSAIGLARWRIVTLIVGEGLALALIAGALGCGLGLVAAGVLARIPAAAGLLYPEISAGLLLQALALAAATGALGALIPALGETARPPAAVLRGK